MKKNIYDKNVSYWIQIYFDWMKMKKKRSYNENIFYWIQIYFDWIGNIFWYHEKRWYNENILLNT